MRIVDPKMAIMIPVETELKWELGMPMDKLNFKMVYWNRQLDKFFQYEGELHKAFFKEVHGDKDDYRWLKNIGAIE